MPCAPFSMLGGPGGTGCDEVCFPVHGGWDSRDVSMFDCVKEHMSCLAIVYNVCISHIVQ